MVEAVHCDTEATAVRLLERVDVKLLHKTLSVASTGGLLPKRRSEVVQPETVSTENC